MNDRINLQIAEFIAQLQFNAPIRWWYVYKKHTLKFELEELYVPKANPQDNAYAAPSNEEVLNWLLKRHVTQILVQKDFINILNDLYSMKYSLLGQLLLETRKQLFKVGAILSRKEYSMETWAEKYVRRKSDCPTELESLLLSTVNMITYINLVKPEIQI